MDLSKKIKEIAMIQLKPFQHISESDYGYKVKKEFIINCADLKDFNNIDIRQSLEYKDLFNELKNLTGPVLYFFEIISDFNHKEIIDNINNYALTENSKAVPAIKKNYPNSNILYVGKVKKGFLGRVIQHLGYYRVNRTQGIQLFYWAKELNLTLRLTAMEFELEAADIMPIFENNLASFLRPIIGKHK
jgi:hypothetical protein